MLNNSEMSASLNKFMQPDAVKEAFVIDNLEKAEWALKKIAEHKAAIQRISDFAKAEIEKIQVWAQEQAKSHEEDVKYFESLLQPFAAEELKGKKTKTVKLPSGKMSFKKTVNYERDEAQLLDFVKSCEMVDYIKVKESLDWAGFKKLCTVTSDGKLITEDGEIVPSVVVVTSEKFSVEV